MEYFKVYYIDPDHPQPYSEYFVCGENSLPRICVLYIRAGYIIKNLERTTVPERIEF